MRNTVEKIYKEKKEIIDQDKQDIESKKADIQGLIDYLRVVHQYGSNANLVMESEILNKRISFLDKTKYHTLHGYNEFGVGFVNNTEAINNFSKICWEQFQQNLVPLDQMKPQLLLPTDTSSTKKTTIGKSAISSQTPHREEECNLGREEDDNEVDERSSDYMEPSTTCDLQPMGRYTPPIVDVSDEKDNHPLLSCALSSMGNSSPDQVKRPMSGPPIPPRISRRIKEPTARGVTPESQGKFYEFTYKLCKLHKTHAYLFITFCNIIICGI